MTKIWKCTVETYEGICGNHAKIKAGRGKKAKYFCKEHELIACAMMLSGVI